MGLDKTTLANSIKAALDATLLQAQDKDNDGDDVRQSYANAIADAFDTYVKGIEIVIGPSVIVVAGSSTTQTNALPITISNTPPNSIT